MILRIPLKKCPCCGGNADYVQSCLFGNGVYVSCNTCQLQTKVVLVDISNDEQAYNEAYGMAARLWNTRNK